MAFFSLLSSASAPLGFRDLQAARKVEKVEVNYSRAAKQVGDGTAGG